MLVWPSIKDFEVRSKRRGKEREGKSEFGLDSVTEESVESCSAFMSKGPTMIKEKKEEE